jgi:hypothetical protein
MNPLLKAFFQDKPTQEAWANFIIETLNEDALQRIYNGEDTSAVKEAREIIEKSFKRLAELCTPKRERKPRERGV